MTCESLLIICNKSTRERQSGEEKKKKQQQHGEKERERERKRTTRAAEKETARSASIADKAVAQFFQVSTACEKKTNQRPTQNSNSYLEHLQRCSVCDPTKTNISHTSKFSYFLSFFQPHQQQQNQNSLGLPIGRETTHHPNTIQYKGSFNTNKFFPNIPL
jgi:hypothetical protein